MKHATLVWLRPQRVVYLLYYLEPLFIRLNRKTTNLHSVQVIVQPDRRTGERVMNFGSLTCSPKQRFALLSAPSKCGWFDVM